MFKAHAVVKATTQPTKFTSSEFTDRLHLLRKKTTENLM